MTKELARLEMEFKADCEDIAILCEEEGYPSCGANYELRVEQLRELEYYAPLFRE